MPASFIGRMFVMVVINALRNPGSSLSRLTLLYGVSENIDMYSIHKGFQFVVSSKTEKFSRLHEAFKAVTLYGGGLMAVSRGLKHSREASFNFLEVFFFIFHLFTRQFGYKTLRKRYHRV
jgi:hypothetical protein